MAKTFGQKLWKYIETPQGFAYLSDAIKEMTDEEAIAAAKAALYWHEQSMQVIKNLLAFEDHKV